jgi:hypothetical protein
MAQKLPDIDKDFDFAMWLWLSTGLLFGVWNGPVAGLFMLCLLMFAWVALGLALKEMNNKNGTKE